MGMRRSSVCRVSSRCRRCPRHPRPSSRRYSAHREGSLRETSSAAQECRRPGRGLFGRLSSCRITGSREGARGFGVQTDRANERPEVLIGGLGMGFTLPRGPFGTRSKRPDRCCRVGARRRAMGSRSLGRTLWLKPRRATSHPPRSGCLECHERSKSAYAAILLDVDNGPEGLTRESNERLYDVRGLMAARAALRPGGVLAVWSSGPDRSFSKRLRQTGW